MREILWVAFTQKPSAEVRVALMNLLWWWVPDKKRWEWRSASTEGHDTALEEVRSRLDALGLDLDRDAEWGIEERGVG